MPRCTRKGCGQEYDEADNTPESCSYHSGAPVFHEGLKSWSCCSDTNKPVLDFDEFMKIQGCTRGSHTTDSPKVEPPKPSAQVDLKMTGSEAGKETYSSAPSGSRTPLTLAVTAPIDVAPVVEEEEDDLSVTVSIGEKCRHSGCKTTFESDEVNRQGDGEGTICWYHPKPPIFHEGSKGYLCCKRRVLEFDEFMKIEGCTKGRHVFVAKAKPSSQQEQFMECRIDHYQTPTEVHVSVFAKQADKEQSTVKIEQNQIHLDVSLPASKRFRKSIELFGPVDPTASSVKYYGTKIELILKKQDTRSWTLLEKTNRDMGNINFTFGVGGRTGTIGAKQVILDNVNQAQHNVQHV